MNNKSYVSKRKRYTENGPSLELSYNDQCKVEKNGRIKEVKRVIEEKVHEKVVDKEIDEIQGNESFCRNDEGVEKIEGKIHKATYSQTNLKEASTKDYMSTRKLSAPDLSPHKKRNLTVQCSSCAKTICIAACSMFHKQDETWFCNSACYRKRYATKNDNNKSRNKIMDEVVQKVMKKKSRKKPQGASRPRPTRANVSTSKCSACAKIISLADCLFPCGEEDTWFCNQDCYRKAFAASEEDDLTCKNVISEISKTVQLNSLVRSKDIVHRDVTPLPLMPTLPLSPPPKEIADRYSLNEKERTIRADLNPLLEAGKEISQLELDYLARAMERADQTVIVKGAASKLTSFYWCWPYILKRCGSLMYHKFKCFISNGDYDYKETSWRSMTLHDYGIYLETRKRLCLERENLTQQGLKLRAADELITVHDNNGKPMKINALRECIYLIDFSIPTYLPELNADLFKNFALPFLPMGKHCLQQYVPEVGRPFMGPNLYITPPGAFTWFHEDGHGTVDSGHQSLTGYNEVIMLRRMDEGNKQQAISCLSGGKYDLRIKPHDSGEKPSWPNDDMMFELEEKGFAPSSFVLAPGEFVHINKGRIHAFRKKKPDFRSQPEDICVSIAWDWMYEGITPDGFNQEAKYALESAENNQKYSVASLAVSETAVVNAIKCAIAARDAKQLLGQEQIHAPSFDGLWLKTRHRTARSARDQNAFLIGLRDSLKKVIAIEDRHENVEPPKELPHLPQANAKQRVCPEIRNDRDAYQVETWLAPSAQRRNPYHVDGFVCKICNVELSNVYKHCVGCEELLSQDYNICVDCHAEKFYGDDYPKFTSLGHKPLYSLTPRLSFIKNIKNNALIKCPCKQKRCVRCGFCHSCSCACHNEFTTRYRFEPPGSLQNLEKKIYAAIED